MIENGPRASTLSLQKEPCLISAFHLLGNIKEHAHIYGNAVRVATKGLDVVPNLCKKACQHVQILIKRPGHGKLDGSTYPLQR